MPASGTRPDRSPPDRGEKCTKYRRWVARLRRASKRHEARHIVLGSTAKISGATSDRRVPTFADPDATVTSTQQLPHFISKVGRIDSYRRYSPASVSRRPASQHIAITVRRPRHGGDQRRRENCHAVSFRRVTANRAKTPHLVRPLHGTTCVPLDARST